MINLMMSLTPLCQSSGKIDPDADPDDFQSDPAQSGKIMVRSS